MKKILFLFLMYLVISCGKDDASSSLTINVDSIGSFQATISWSFQGANGQTLFKIVLENEVVEEAYGGNQYTFNNLQNDTSYSGVVFAISQNGDETFQEFSFRTTPLDPQNQDPTVWRGPAVLNNQVEVDTFGFRAVTGRLWILGTDITNLSGLNALESVGGLKIQNTSLQSLNGLENLETVEDPSLGIEIEIIDNSLLIDLTLLSNVSNYTNNLIVVDNNPSLNLLGLGAGNSVDFIRLENCTTSNFSMFSNVQNLQRLIMKDVQVMDAHGMQGFNNISTVLQFDLNNVSGIEDFSGFENLTEVTNNPFRVINCPDLTSLTGLVNFTNTNGRVYLENLPNLQNIDALQQFSGEDVEIELTDLPNLANIEGLSGLTGAVKIIKFENLTSINNLQGLHNIVTIQKLELRELHSIVDLQGLENLTEVTENFLVKTLNNFTSTNGLQNLQRVVTSYNEYENRPNGSFSFLFLPQFTSFEGLENLTFMGQLSIDSCDALTTLNGLENVSQAHENGAWVTIILNNNLYDFCGLRPFANLVSHQDGGIVLNAYNPTWSQIQSETQCSL
jgi:hypothetical protein